MSNTTHKHISTQDIAAVIVGQCSDSRAKHQPIFGSENIDINRKFWSTLRKNAIKSAQHAGIPYKLCKDTSHKDYADNLSIEISNLFDEGWQKLIIVGIDSPNLSADTLSRCAKLLETRDWVLEPSETDGVNLLGIKAANFQLDEFRSLPWNRDGFFHECVGYIRTLNQSLSILPSNPCFTTRESLDQWLETSPNKVLSLVINGLLFKERYKNELVKLPNQDN